MLLRFQKAAMRGNYETGNQVFSMRLRFLTIGDPVDSGIPEARRFFVEKRWFDVYTKVCYSYT